MYKEYKKIEKFKKGLTICLIFSLLSFVLNMSVMSYYGYKIYKMNKPPVKKEKICSLFDFVSPDIELILPPIPEGM